MNMQQQSDVEALTEALTEANRQIDELNQELDDLRILYEATIEHGEAVEDQLAENNLLLLRTQQRLDEELQEAIHYVMSTIPERRAASPKADWLLVPSTELGGDSLGYHEIDADHMAFYLLDVCGHGVGAALLSVTAINVLRSAALPQTDFRDPSAVLTGLNNAFPMEKQNNMYFTIWYGVYNRSTGILNYASAGHPPSLLLRGGDDSAPAEVEELFTRGMPVGSFPGLKYSSQGTEVHPGDRLVVFSDGAFEVEIAPSEMLPFSAFSDFLAHGNGSDPESVLAWIRSLNGSGPFRTTSRSCALRFEGGLPLMGLRLH